MIFMANDTFEKAWDVIKEDENEDSPEKAFWREKGYVIDPRIIDMANAANDWGHTLAHEDHHESVFEHIPFDSLEEYDAARYDASDLHEKIWEAGLKALGLKR